jgi:hypothetical protein
MKSGGQACVAALAIYLVQGCAQGGAEPDVNAEAMTVTRTQEGLTIDNRPVQEGAAGGAAVETEAVASSLSGCTHIQYCNSGNPVICKVDNRNCSHSILQECISDADYVCGNDWVRMRIQ